MSKEWKVQVIHDDTGEVVTTFEYSSERSRDKGFQGLLINMNLVDFTAQRIDPSIELIRGIE
jgi:hypothetical protein|tara:strand:+ start:1746 stop:1931 length:186 start_codon:yes stop_codon:yes gene_type:complete